MTKQKKLLKHIQDTIDDWTSEAIYYYDLYGVVDHETAKKLILFGATTIAYEVDDE
jgi:hypothetical protein